MHVIHSAEPLKSLDADALVVGVYKDACTAAADEVDRANGGIIGRLLEVSEFKPEVGKVLPLYYPSGLKCPLVLLSGLGARTEIEPSAAFQAMASATRWLTERARGQIAIAGDRDWSDEITEASVAGAAVGCFGPGLYRAQPNRTAPNTIKWLDVSADAVDRGQVIAEAVNLTRRLVNEPPSVIYPETFAQAAEAAAHEAGLEIEIWDVDRLQAERCGALLAVAQGSLRSPRLVILTHRGASTDAPWLSLVGKGVTFDSGGLSLKPSDSMLSMKCDMAGAATVLGAMQAIARLKLPLNVMGLMGLVENLPSGTAYKLGDVLTARNGKTIEVHNTDAEGRLVLSRCAVGGGGSRCRQIDRLGDFDRRLHGGLRSRCRGTDDERPSLV